MRKLAGFISMIIGISVFIGWMILVGNPHVVETFLGLIISTVVGIWVFFKLSPKTKRNLIDKIKEEF
jgi:multisubunit Na+/H+ antiporter MnhE subunit